MNKMLNGMRDAMKCRLGANLAKGDSWKRMPVYALQAGMKRNLEKNLNEKGYGKPPG